MDVKVQFETSNRPAEIKLDYCRPALVGSEKQVAWANEIRANVERGVVDVIGQGFPLLLESDSDAALAAALVRIRAALASDTGNLLDRLFERAEARFWIDSRHMSIHDLLSREAR